MRESENNYECQEEKSWWQKYLSARQNRTDLLEVNKITSENSGNPLQDLFTVDYKGKTMGHTLKLIKM